MLYKYYSLLVGGGLTYFVDDFSIQVLSGSHAISLQKPSPKKTILNQIYFEC
jgi:hypothetical protein